MEQRVPTRYVVCGSTIWLALLKWLKNTVVESARLVRCVSVVEAGRVDVYCLTVPSYECFVIEGGLVVSNCADEWRYACMSRPFVPVPVVRARSAPDVGYAPFRSAAPDDWKLY
jgi:hypothetical protein